MTTPGVAGVVLAAGASRRLGTAKQLLLDTAGRPLVAVAAGRLLEAGCGPVLVVTGFAHDEVARAVAGMPVEVVFNGDWSDGMASSIRTAIAWLERPGAESTTIAALVTVTDMPGVFSTHYQDIIATSSRGLARVYSNYAASPFAPMLGVPALFPRADWPALSALSGDRGARGLLSRPETLSVSIGTGALDLDTPTDVARWRAT